MVDAMPVAALLVRAMAALARMVDAMAVGATTEIGHHIQARSIQVIQMAPATAASAPMAVALGAIARTPTAPQDASTRAMAEAAGLPLVATTDATMDRALKARAPMEQSILDARRRAAFRVCARSVMAHHTGQVVEALSTVPAWWW